MGKIINPMREIVEKIGVTKAAFEAWVMIKNGIGSIGGDSEEEIIREALTNIKCGMAMMEYLYDKGGLEKEMNCKINKWLMK